MSVGVAMAAMAALRVIHPPAGGTPIAIMISHAGWDYLFTPVLAGAVILAACALGYRILLRWAVARGERQRVADSTGEKGIARGD